MYVACSTLCFGKSSFEDALRTIRDLHFQKIDLAIHEQGPHNTLAEVVAEPGRIIQQMRASNLQVAAMHLMLNDPSNPEAPNYFRVIGRLARLTTTPLICTNAASFGSDFDAEVQRLTELTKILVAEGVMLTVETHRDTLTADPMGAVELCKRVPGLGLTLDPSHYLVGPHKPESFDVVMKHVRHTRLRDTGATDEQFQVRVGQGQIEYGRVIAGLARFKYQRALTVDIRDIPEASFPVDAEVRKLKYLLESLV